MHCLISAIPSEIEDLIQNKELEHTTNSNHWLDKKKRVVIAYVGVGYLETAVNLQKLILQFPQIKKVTFCGTAGIYPLMSHLKIGDLCQCKEVILCDASAEMGNSAYVPLLQHAPLKAEMGDQYPAVSVKVATMLSITTNDQVAGQICNNTQAEVENMELYGVATICNKKKISWNAILGLTNYVGSNGRDDWQSKHKAIEKQLNRLLYNIYRI